MNQILQGQYNHSMKSLCVLSPSVMFNSLQPHGLQPARLLCPWGFSRQEYWSGLACPPPGDLPDPGLKPRSPALQVDSLPSEPPGTQNASLLLFCYSRCVASSYVTSIFKVIKQVLQFQSSHPHGSHQEGRREECKRQQRIFNNREKLLHFSDKEPSYNCEISK